MSLSLSRQENGSLIRSEHRQVVQIQPLKAGLTMVEVSRLGQKSSDCKPHHDSPDIFVVYHFVTSFGSSSLFEPVVARLGIQMTKARAHKAVKKSH